MGEKSKASKDRAFLRLPNRYQRLYQLPTIKNYPYNRSCCFWLIEVVGRSELAKTYLTPLKNRVKTLTFTPKVMQTKISSLKEILNKHYGNYLFIR